jgi:hypothetical protein
MQINTKRNRSNHRQILQSVQNDYHLTLHSKLNEKDRLHLMNQVRKQVDLLYKKYRHDMDIAKLYHAMLRKVLLTMDWLHDKRYSGK